MPGVGAEGEVEERVDHGGGEDGPLHHRFVGLAERQELLGQRQQTSSFPFGQNHLDVEQLERGAGCLEDEDEEESDEGEPEVGGSETSCAASSGLDEEGEPGDDQEDDRQEEGEDERGEEEVQARRLPPLAETMHAHLGVVGPAPEHVVLVRVHLDVVQLGEEGRGDGEEGGEEPYEGDVDGVRPGSRHVLALSPLRVLDKEVEGEEDGGEGEEEEEAVVEIPGKQTQSYSLHRHQSAVNQISWSGGI